MFHVKHKKKERNVFRSFFCFALLCPLLSGDSDGKQNFPVSILPLAIGGHPGGLHQVQPPLDRVQEQPHILDDDGRLTSLGRGGEKGSHISLSFRYGKPLLCGMAGGLLLHGRVSEGEQCPGVTLGEAGFPQKRKNRRGEL